MRPRRPHDADVEYDNIPHPDTFIMVLGTATDVGKTWTICRLIESLRRRNMTVAVRKLIQSFDPDDPRPTDAELLAAASGEDVYAVCPEHMWFPLPLAPPIAALELGLEPPLRSEVISGYLWTENTDVGIVEGVGGLMSPIAIDGDNITLIEYLIPDHLLIVTDAGLGTINAVNSAIAALDARQALTDVEQITVFLNLYDESLALHRRNREWLYLRPYWVNERYDIRVVTDIEDIIHSD
jgi:dethiobiotin synthetase